MEEFGIPAIQPSSPKTTTDEVTRPAEATRKREPGQTNFHMPWAAQLDLGAGVKPMVYAEYSNNEAADRVSIKIIDPATGAVIRELPSEDVLSYSEELSAYEELGRKHIT